MLSFLELAISWVGQFKVFCEYIFFMLLEALKRNYYTSSNIFQCRALYKKRNQIDTLLDSLFLSRLADSSADSDCWKTINPNPSCPLSEQHYFVKTSIDFFFSWDKYWRVKCLVWIAMKPPEPCQFLWSKKTILSIQYTKPTVDSSAGKEDGKIWEVKRCVLTPLEIAGLYFRLTGSQTDVFLKRSQKVTNTVHWADVLQVTAKVRWINTVLPAYLNLALQSCRLLN